MLEFRAPVSPYRAVIMTWLDQHDADVPLAQGSREQAASLNAFTIANADREWFHPPGASPPVASAGRLLPLSPQLVRNYRAGAVASSQRRRKVGEWLDSVKGQTLQVRDKIIIR
jgi:hypothetical protein